MLLDCLSINALLDEPTILQLPTPYRSTITRKFLGLLEGRLLCYKPIPTVTKNMCRIIVPTSLRHTTFNLMHSTPVAGHMGEYKILCRIRLRFVLASITFSCFWMNQQVYPLYDHVSFTSKGQELMFSWPVSSPFAIPHVDLWMPGHYTDINSYIACMNVMCGMR